MKTNTRAAAITAFVILLILSVVYLTPIYVMVITALKTPEEINRGQYLMPTWTPVWHNFVEVLLGSERFRSDMLPRLFHDGKGHCA